MMKFTNANGNSCLRHPPVYEQITKIRVPFSEIKSYIMDDILDDIKFILNRLKKSGIEKSDNCRFDSSKVGNPRGKGYSSGT